MAFSAYNNLYFIDLTSNFKSTSLFVPVSRYSDWIGSESSVTRDLNSGVCSALAREAAKLGFS